MTLDHLKLRTKSLIPLAVMAFTIVAIVVLAAQRLSAVSGTANEIIQNRDLAATMLARANRRMSFLPFDVLAAIDYDNDDEGGKAATRDYKTVLSETNALIDSAAEHAPDRATAIGAFKKRFGELYEKSKAPYELAYGNPGATHGLDLKPAEIEAMAKAAKMAIEIDLGVRKLVADIAQFNDALLKENVERAAGLETESRDAIGMVAAIGLAATLIAGAFSWWMSSAKIARPLGDVVGRMQALARGELQVEISGQTRRDEVGDIARAVEVFKQNALDRARLESEATTQRARAEAERERAAAERAKAAEEQAEAVRRLGDGLRNVAGGDLMVRLGDGFTSAYAQIRDDFNGTIDKLKATIATVVHSTGTIESSAREVTVAADDLSHRTERQASSLEEATATLTEVTAAVKKAADGTQHARAVVAAADEDAKKSAAVMRQAVEAMSGIAKSSQQIGQIIGVIDEIAFQTNLLALNAGVEAARAGEAGRGFAVVASEVRALAQRSAEAAKEIKGLISNSNAQVDAGVELVAATGRSLDRITSQVAEINTVVTDIAVGAQQQATALQQINAAVEEMNMTTQQNAAMVEESTAAGHSLSEETGKLAQLVGQFRVGDSGVDEGALRAELAKAAPHAFRAASECDKLVARPAAKALAKKAAVNAPRAAAAEEWTEF